eukprot:1196292-Prorocentrum_minimum.AAC.1
MEMLGDWQVREKEKGDLLDRGGLQGARARVQSLLISSLLDKKESLRVEPSLYRWYGEGALNSLPPVVGSKAAGYEGHRLLKAPKSPGSAASVVGSDAANTGARLLNTAAIRGTRVDVRGTRVDVRGTRVDVRGTRVEYGRAAFYTPRLLEAPAWTLEAPA